MQLADLRWHWGDAYEINWAGTFRGVRRDNGLPLEAASAEELRDADQERLLASSRSEAIPTLARCPPEASGSRSTRATPAGLSTAAGCTGLRPQASESIACWCAGVAANRACSRRTWLQRSSPATIQPRPWPGSWPSTAQRRRRLWEDVSDESLAPQIRLGARMRRLAHRVQVRRRGAWVDMRGAYLRRLARGTREVRGQAPDEAHGDDAGRSVLASPRNAEVARFSADTRREWRRRAGSSRPF